MKELNKATPRSIGSKRLDSEIHGHLERAFVEAWQLHYDPDECQDREMLARLTSTEVETREEADWQDHYQLAGGMRLECGPITDRDLVLIETFVQWLGTNCGRAFIERALSLAGRRIVKSEEQYIIESQAYTTAMLRRYRDNDTEFTGARAAMWARQIHRDQLDDSTQWGNAYYRCPHCETPHDLEGEEDLQDPRPFCSGSYAEEGICDYQYQREDLRISEGWIERL